MGVIDAGNRNPKPFAKLRAVFTSNVRDRTSASRARITASSACCSALRCSTACNKLRSARASRASFTASLRSFLVSLAVIHFSSRALATITSWPSLASSRAIHADCIPTSIATLAWPRLPKCLAIDSPLLRNDPSSTACPSSFRIT